MRADHGRDLEPFTDTAAGRGVHLDDVGCAGLDEVTCSPPGVFVLAAGDGHVELLDEQRAAPEVIGMDRFLEPVGVVLLDHPSESQRGTGIPRVVGIDREFDVGSDRFPHSPDTLCILLQSHARPADLHLDCPEPGIDVAPQFRGKILLLFPILVVSPRRIREHPVLHPAGEFPDGLAGSLPDEVPQGVVYRTHGADVVSLGDGFSGAAHIHPVPEVVDPHRVLANQLLADRPKNVGPVDSTRAAGGHADHALIRVDFEPSPA